MTLLPKIVYEDRKGHNFTQEFITLYTPEQNGMSERFFRTIKIECSWHYNFTSLKEANGVARKMERFLQQATKTFGVEIKNPS